MLRIVRVAVSNRLAVRSRFWKRLRATATAFGLADLSKKVGLHNSTTFHLVKTMVSLGYIRQLKESKRYRIGRPLFALAASALDEMEMVSMATPVLDDLSRPPAKAAISPRA